MNNKAAMALFLCPICWERIPQYELSEVDYVLYIKCACVCSVNPLQLELCDYLEKIREKASIAMKCTVNPNHNKQSNAFSLKARYAMCEDCELASRLMNKSDVIISQKLLVEVNCKAHPQKELSYYCSCKRLICSKCHKEEHVFHTFKSFQMLTGILSIKRDKEYITRYQSKVDIKTQSLLSLPLSTTQEKTLREVLEFNMRNSQLLDTLVNVLFNTYDVINMQPDETLANLLMKFEYNSEVNIEGYTYEQYLTFLKSHLIVSGIKTQFAHLSSTPHHPRTILCVLQLTNKKIAVGTSNSLLIYSLLNTSFTAEEQAIPIESLCCMIEASINDISYIVIACRSTIQSFGGITAYNTSLLTIASNTMLNKSDNISCMLFLGNNRIVAGFDNNAIVIYDCSELKSLKVAMVLQGHTDTITCLIKAKDRLISSASNVLKVWPFYDKNLLDRAFGSHISALQLIDNTKLIIAEENGVISLWNMLKDKTTELYKTEKGNALCSVLLICSNTYLVASYEKDKKFFRLIKSEDASEIALAPVYEIENKEEADWCISQIPIQNDFLLCAYYHLLELYHIQTNVIVNLI